MYYVQIPASICYWLFGFVCGIISVFAWLFYMNRKIEKQKKEFIESIIKKPNDNESDNDDSDI